MFVDPRTAAKLNRAIFNAIVAPRPIGWISSQSPEGHVNLAPFSHFKEQCEPGISQPFRAR